MRSVQTLVEWIIPAYNEERRIEQSLRDHICYFQQEVGDTFRITVVVNNSTDNTTAVVKQVMQQYPDQIRLIEIDKNIGKGGAVLAGFYAANADFVGFVDADSSVKTPDLVAMLGYLQTQSAADGVVGSRYANMHKKARRSLSAHIRSRMFNTIVTLLFGMHFQDTQCGAKLFRAAPLAAVLPKISVTNMAFDVDLLVQLCSAKYAIHEYAIDWVSDEDTTISNFGSTSMQMLKSCITLRFPRLKRFDFLKNE